MRGTLFLYRVQMKSVGTGHHQSEGPIERRGRMQQSKCLGQTSSCFRDDEIPASSSSLRQP